MTWMTFLLAWLALGLVLAPLVGKLLSRSALSLFDVID